MTPTGIEALVCEDISARQKVGLVKYQVSVADSGLSDLEWVRHFYTELLDACVYARKIIARMEATPTPPGEIEFMTTEQQIIPEGYLPGIEINAAYARLHPRNCAVRERTADGIPVGPCSFYLENGTTCPRHGRVRGVTDPETTTTPPPQ